MFCSRPFRAMAGVAARAGAVCLVTMAAVACECRAADRTVVAVFTIDGYADIKKQIGWLGMQVGQPGLAGVVESLVFMALQGRGTAGLDVRRPLGAVVTTDGTDVAVQGFIPVKDLDQLLESLQAITGPVERSDDVRTLTLPSGVTLDVTTLDGWAVVVPQGMRVPPLDPAPLFAPLSENYTIGIELFPHRLPEPLRMQLRLLIEQAAAAARQGQPVDARALGRGFDAVAGTTESFSLGMNVDVEKGRVFLENRTVAVPGSPVALAMAGAGGGRLTVAMPRPADGDKPAISAHLVQQVPDAVRRELLAMTQTAWSAGTDDPLAGTIAVLVRELLVAVLGTGGIDAAASIDMPADRGVGRAVPEVTVGVRVQDGAALQTQLKQALAAAAPGGRLLPDRVKVAFDAGKVGTATLHTVSVGLAGSDAAATLGDMIELTLAVTPEYAFLLAGGDPRLRVASLLGPEGRVDAAAKPIAGIDVAVDRLVDAAGQAAVTDKDTDAEQSHGQVRLLVRPIERGLATRVSADAAALRALQSTVVPSGVDPAAAGPPPGLPLPNGLPLPAPSR